MDSSYRRYRQYRANRQQYRVDQMAAPIAVMLILGFVTKYWWILITLLLIVYVFKFSKTNGEKKNGKIEHDSGAGEKISDAVREINFQKEETMFMNTTEIGYVNRNNQRNNGKTDIPGTGNGQWFYDMECLDCGHKYHANGHDVWLRKCPKCQGGRP